MACYNSSVKMRLLKNICHSCRKYFVTRQSASHIRFSSTVAALKEEDNEVVEYPPIKPRYPPGNWGQLKSDQAWREYEFNQRLNEIADVRERLEKLADKTVPIWKVYQIFDSIHALPCQQYVTKTHLIQGLPDIYDSIDVETELQTLKPVIISTILRNAARHATHSSADGQQVQLSQCVNDIFATLACQHDHLRRAQVDENVEVKSFWSRYGFDLDDRVKDQREDGIIRNLCSKLTANMQIRTELPLPQLISQDSDVCMSGSYPDLPYHPSVVGIKKSKDRLMTVSGHWISDPCEYVHTSFHCDSSDLREIRDKASDDRVRRNILGNGIINLFTSTLAQAYNQGFNMFQDITYPLTTQTVMSDGQKFTFFAYQLNTIHLWLTDEHQPLRNVCWATQEMALYDKVENGEVHGFNDDVLRHLLKFLKLQTQDRGVDMRPYLKEESSVNEKVWINEIGTPATPQPSIARWRYPRNALYF